MATAKKSDDSFEEFEWSPEREVHLFYALRGHKPVGVNRFFQIILVQEKFNALLGKEVPTDVLWNHLDTIYDMDALHENEDLPFPNDEVEFSLPEEYHKNSSPKNTNSKGSVKKKGQTALSNDRAKP